MIQELLQLTDAQKKIALEGCSTKDISSLAKDVFPEAVASGRIIDGRSLEGKSLKAFLAGEQIVVRTSKMPPAGPLELTEEQKRMIEEMAPRVESTIELARVVFNDPTIKSLSREWRAVFAYYKQVFPDNVNVSEEPVETVVYQPPATLQILVSHINGYVTSSDQAKKAYQWGALKHSEERQLRRLMGYMRIYTFKYMASQYEQQADRELFISTFIRWAHDKPDLTEIEVDQMISAAAERVNIAQIDRTIQRIDKMQREIMDSGGEIEKNGKKRKFGMTDVELINGFRAKHDVAKGRFEKLMEKLEESRSERHDKIDARSGSILNLFDAWMKDEQMRNDMADMGAKEHEEDRKEVGRIRDLDDMTAIIAGMSEEEGAS